MKAVLFKNPSSPSSSFLLQEDIGPYFYDILHYHKEYQITAIYKGEGTLFAGDRIDRFQAGDVFLFPPNLPHVFRNDAAYYANGDSEASRGISIYFQRDSFGTNFLELPESRQIKNLLETADGGIQFVGTKLAAVQASIEGLQISNGLRRLMLFMSLLEELSLSFEHQRISGIDYKNPIREIDNERINLTFEYVMKNFHTKIRLDDISDIVNMSPASFSRYFKQRTRKTFSRFVNEVRIGNACQLMRKANDSIFEAAYLSGYNNLSNFNRQFKLIVGYSPREYIRKMDL